MLKLLWVDDEPGNIKYMPALFSSFEIKLCYSASEALSILSEGNFDAIISDLNMPGINGLDLLQSVFIQHPGVYKILASAFAEEKGVEYLSTKYVDYVIDKPWDAVEIETKLNTLFS